MKENGYRSVVYMALSCAAIGATAYCAASGQTAWAVFFGVLAIWLDNHVLGALNFMQYESVLSTMRTLNFYRETQQMWRREDQDSIKKG